MREREKTTPNNYFIENSAKTVRSHLRNPIEYSKSNVHMPNRVKNNMENVIV